MKQIAISGTARVDLGKKAAKEIRKMVMFLAFSTEKRRTKTALPLLLTSR